MRIEDAHEGRALCAKQAEVSPVSNKSHKHALRAMWIDDCELWVKMHSRPNRWPLEAAKRLEARAHAVRSAGTLGRRRRHSAKTSGRADSLANQRFVNEDYPAACLRTALAFGGAVFRACALRVLGTSALRAFAFSQAFASTVRNRRSAALVAHWAYFALLRPQGARFVRFLNSQWSSCCA